MNDLEDGKVYRTAQCGKEAAHAAHGYADRPFLMCLGVTMTPEKAARIAAALMTVTRLLFPPAKPRFMHNVLAHPLLVLWPRVGRWLHEHTKP